jgi:hypothetical protein
MHNRDWIETPTYRKAHMRRTSPLLKRKGKQPPRDHRGTPSSRPTSFKHSLVSSLASMTPGDQGPVYYYY